MNSETLLLRQINPSWVQQGRVSSQAFRPTPKDEKLLSVYDSDLISPEDSWLHFTTEQGFYSVGVLAVSVEECRIINLDARSDPRPFPEHAVIDFTGLAENQIKTKAKLLSKTADHRGWLYRDDVFS